MGKKGLSDKVRAKRKDKGKQATNPFEVKVNKVKHVVVNKRVQSWEKGLPGVSRSKAVKKRKDTLLRELHHSKKSNSLLDKRFGEGDSNLTADEKMVQRFALEKKKQMQAADFNFDDNEEILTHYGQSLAENLQDTIGSDSDEDDDRVVRNITGDMQFGGLSKNDDGMSWKDKMKDIIADSKKQKYERQAEKEKVVETTNELDSIWKTVVPSMKTVMQRPPPSKKTSSYMMLFLNLVREQKSAGASEKLKTDEEKAKEEAEKLQVLEAQRLSRMRGDTEKPKSNHVSADDLNDGFALESKKDNRVAFLAFPNSEKEHSEDENDKGDDDEDEENDKDGEESSEDEENKEEDDNEGSDDEEEDEASDNYSDLASDGDDDNDVDDKEGDDNANAGISNSKAAVKSILKKTEQPKMSIVKGNTGKPTSDLPYIYTAPGSYEELVSLLHGHSAEEQAIILSRLRKCHHPSLAEGNKDKLEKIHEYLLAYFGELVSVQSIDIALVNHVTYHVWEMGQMFPATMATYCQKYVLEQQKEYTELQQRRNGKAAFVGLDVLLNLSLIGAMFPTSDYRHPVTTPTIAFTCQILSECTVRNFKDCIVGLYLCAQAVEFVKLSRRYIPEVVTFLHGLLVLGVDKKEESEVKVFPPMRKNMSRISDLLQVRSKCEVLKEWSLSEMMHKEETELGNDSYKCGAVYKCVELLQQCISLWSDLPDLAEVFRPIKEPLSILPVHNYSDKLKEMISDLKSKIREGEAKKLVAMQLPMKKPEPLKLFEPKVEEFWSGKKKKGGPNREVNDRQRLTYKLKREMKAAVREIKRDNEVLATHQLETMAKRDADRKRKTKALMNSLANQEGDYNAIKKGKTS